MPTFNVELNSKPKQDGRYSIFIRVTHNRKHKRISIGKYIKKDFFKHKAKYGFWIKSSCPESKKLNKFIKFKISELDGAFSNNEMQPEPKSMHTVIKQIDRPNESDFFIFGERVISRCNTRGQYRTAEKRTHVLNKIKKHLNRETLLFSDLTTTFLKDYEAYLHSIGNKTNTIHTDLKVIKSIVNQAISENIIKQTDNPFLNYRLKTAKTFKERLTETEIQKLVNLDLNKGSKLWHTRNYFLFSLYCAGIRFGDLAVLKWSKIKDSRLDYTMNKTAGTSGSIKSIPLNSKALEILKNYKFRGQGKDHFIFPLLSNKIDESDIPQLKRQISSKNAQTNKYLKDLVSLAEIDKRISFHVARHSFADIARKKTNDVYGISKALGHSDLKITQGYLESLDLESIDATMNQTFGD